MFELKAESHTNVMVLRYHGNLLLPDVAQFSKLLEEYLLAPDIRQVVLDLSRVEKVDTSGLGVLVSASTKGRKSPQQHARRQNNAKKKYFFCVKKPVTAV